MASISSNLNLQSAHSPPAKGQTEIRSRLPGELANMSRRAAPRTTSLVNTTSTTTTSASRCTAATLGNRPIAAHGPSLTVLTQDHPDIRVRTRIDQIQGEVLEDPTAAKLVMDIDRIETEHPEKCHQYTASSIKNYTSMLFTSALFSSTLDEGDKIAERAPFLRLPEPGGAKTVQEFLRENPPSKEDPFYDEQSHIRKELTSTSPILFSNPHDPGESTWWYYRGNSNCVMRSPADYFEMVFDRYNLLSDPEDGTLRRQKIEELTRLHISLQRCAYEYLCAMRGKEAQEEDLAGIGTSREPRDSRGVVFQFGIPEDVVHQVCFPAKAYGIPHPSISSFPATVRAQCAGEFPPDSTPGVKGDIENTRMSLQGRLLAQSVMVPGNGIQSYVHGYGRFFNPEMDSGNRESESAMDPETAATVPSLVDACKSEAAIANKAENSFECLELIVRKEAILAKAKRIFADAIEKSPAHTKKRV